MNERCNQFMENKTCTTKEIWLKFNLKKYIYSNKNRICTGLYIYPHCIQLRRLVFWDNVTVARASENCGLFYLSERHNTQCVAAISLCVCARDCLKQQQQQEQQSDEKNMVETILGYQTMLYNNAENLVRFSRLRLTSRMFGISLCVMEWANFTAVTTCEHNG